MLKKPKFKQSFLDHYKELTNLKEFIKYCEKPPRKSFRVNTLKTTIPEIKKRLSKYKLSQIPWCKQGFYLEGKTDLGNLIEHQLGYIYIQSSTSMLPPEVLEIKENQLILDMAASPGSKTTQIAALAKNTGLIIANDISTKRLIPLATNLQRNGVLNTIISKQHGRFFKNLEADRVLLDAPCSGTGIIRKSPSTPTEWSVNLVKQLAGIQRQLIKVAFQNLKKNGILVYSTCSLEPDENEKVIENLLETYENAKLEKIKIKSSPLITDNKEIKNSCLRIWPQDFDTDGFFVAKIKKI